uniref:Round spermatid basic protein 1 n=1 Tax=Leptobrachium leishanense TaxID=445787 RepID=A0A8C5LTZ6_9ANUR
MAAQLGTFAEERDKAKAGRKKKKRREGSPSSEKKRKKKEGGGGGRREDGEKEAKRRKLANDTHHSCHHHHHHHHRHHHHHHHGKEELLLRPPPSPPGLPQAAQCAPPISQALFTLSQLERPRDKSKKKHREKKENGGGGEEDQGPLKTVKKEISDENGRFPCVIKADDDAFLKKMKKKKKKKHRDDDFRGRRLKMYNKEVQTLCAGLTRIHKESLEEVEDDKESCRYLQDEQLCRSDLGTEEYRVPQEVQMPFASHQEHCIRTSTLHTGSKFSRLMHEENQSNGGAPVLHAYMDELSFLSPAEMERFAEEFLERTFAENEKSAGYYALAIVHGAAAYLPDFLDYFAFNFPNTPVKMEILGKKDIATTTIANFHTQVSRTYCCGTYRAGPMRQISLVGAVDEEVGDFFPEFLDMLEESPFLKASCWWLICVFLIFHNVKLKCVAN